MGHPHLVCGWSVTHESQVLVMTQCLDAAIARQLRIWQWNTIPPGFSENQPEPVAVQQDSTKHQSPEQQVTALLQAQVNFRLFKNSQIHLQASANRESPSGSTNHDQIQVLATDPWANRRADRHHRHDILVPHRGLDEFVQPISRLFIGPSQHHLVYDGYKEASICHLCSISSCTLSTYSSISVASTSAFNEGCPVSPYAVYFRASLRSFRSSVTSGSRCSCAIRCAASSRR